MAAHAAPAIGDENMAVVRAVSVVQVESTADAAVVRRGTDTAVAIAVAVGSIGNTTNAV
jgi:nicotinamide mononucleotide (NMN) deamidase PncC